jgi:hypothetical protein
MWHFRSVSITICQPHAANFPLALTQPELSTAAHGRSEGPQGEFVAMAEAESRAGKLLWPRASAEARDISGRAWAQSRHRLTIPVLLALSTDRYQTSILVVDESGHITLDSRTLSPSHLDLSDRYYFQVHRDDNSVHRPARPCPASVAECW